MRSVVTLAAAAALCLPAGAQAQTPPSAEAVVALRCAVWAAQIGGGSDDPEQERALSFALTYFIGRFEGISGLNFDEWATLDLVVKVAEDQDKTADLCLPQMLSIGGRMQTWGSKIQQEAATLEDPAAGS